MKYLVTGGTGFLGEHLLRILAEDPSNQLVALSRSHSHVLEEMGIAQVRGSVSEGEELAKALIGCDGVFHLAGVVSRDPNDGQRMMRTHVDGTRRLMEAAHRCGVKRVVVASSSGTIAVSKEERIHDEDSGYATDLVAGWPYYASKLYQEKLALQLGEELGIEVVIINPSLLLGPGDRRLSSTEDVLKFLRKEIPVVPHGGVNFVDVRDAAQATAAAMTKGRTGQGYLLGGPNWTFEEFFGRLSRASEVRAPRLKLPSKWQTFGASLLETAYRHMDSEPPVDRISVEMGQHFWWIDSSKATNELGFESRDPALTLVDTVNYLKRNIATDL